MTPRVLYVDDEPVMRRMVARILLEAFPGAEVDVAADSEEGFDLALSRGYDLIVTGDYQMPFRGSELGRRLRKTARHRRTPMVLWSGFTKEPEVDVLLQETFDAFLRKPTTTSEILDTFARLLPAASDLASEVRLVRLGIEQPSLDYKGPETSVATGNEAAALAKDVIAMANSGGGDIVIGRDDLKNGSFGSEGVSEKTLAAFEVSVLNRALAPYMDPEVHVSVTVVRDAGKVFLLLRVPPAPTVVLAAKQNDVAKLYPGRIYIRTTSVESREAQTSAEVRTVLDRIASLAHAYARA